MKKPGIAVDGIVLKEGKLALVYRKNEPKGWALPGGFVEYDESLENAVKREVMEETGLKVAIKKSPGPSQEFSIYDDPERDPRGRTISVVFVCGVIQGEPVADSDAEKVQFFDLKEASRMDLVFDHGKILEDFRKSSNV